MVDINRVRVELTGFVGGPGVSTFYTTSVGGFRAQLNAFYESMIPLLPSVLTYTIAQSGDVIDPLSGELTGSWVDATAFDGTGTDTDPYPAPCGLCVDWNTGDILDGHRLRGRTFMVPMSGGVYDADGTISATPLSATRVNAAALVSGAAGSFVVWHRPRATPARAGGFSVVTSSTVNDKVAVLRSRRD